MKTFFLGHGNPMYAIEDNGFAGAWRDIGQNFRPEAVVAVSAHWDTDGTFVTSNLRQRTIHDFYGFPQSLFDVVYDPPGAPELAREIAERTAIGCSDDWGLDHGTWAILRHVFPNADVPVIQISLDRRKSPAEHFRFARGLRFLREKRILFIGSGNIVHNLRLVNFRRRDGDDWAVRANEKVKRYVADGDSAGLCDYSSLGDDVRLAVPTPEHFLPLLYAMAVGADGVPPRVFNDVVELGSLSMTSFDFS